MALARTDQRAIHGLEGSGILLFVGLALGTDSHCCRTVAGAMLFGLQPHDPLTLVLAMSLLAAVAVASSYLPARRASRLDPIVGAKGRIEICCTHWLVVLWS